MGRTWPDEARGKAVTYGVPYGARARMILLYLQTQAVRTGSREVALGRSMRDWMERMGLAIGGETARSLREQAARISACTLKFFWEDDDTKGGRAARSSPPGCDFKVPEDSPGQPVGGPGRPGRGVLEGPTGSPRAAAGGRNPPAAGPLHEPGHLRLAGLALPPARASPPRSPGRPCMRSSAPASRRSSISSRASWRRWGLPPRPIPRRGWSGGHRDHAAPGTATGGPAECGRLTPHPPHAAMCRGRRKIADRKARRAGGGSIGRGPCTPNVVRSALVCIQDQRLSNRLCRVLAAPFPGFAWVFLSRAASRLGARTVRSASRMSGRTDGAAHARTWRSRRNTSDLVRWVAPGTRSPEIGRVYPWV